MVTASSSLNNSGIFSQTMVKRSNSRPKSPHDGWRPAGSINANASVLNFTGSTFTKSDMLSMQPAVSHVRRKATVNGRSLTTANSRSRTPSNQRSGARPASAKPKALLGPDSATITTSFKEN